MAYSQGVVRTALDQPGDFSVFSAMHLPLFRALHGRALFGPLISLTLANGLVPLAAQTPVPPKPQSTPPAPVATGEPWRIVQSAQATVVLARDGSVIGEIWASEKRQSVSIRTLPKYLAASLRRR